MKNKKKILQVEELEQYLKKVVVKTKDDLPNKDIVIYGKYKNSVTIEAISFNKDDLQWGIANLDWYFLPITQEELQEKICSYPKTVRRKMYGK
jgi:hypothetical protein